VSEQGLGSQHSPMTAAWAGAGAEGELRRGQCQLGMLLRAEGPSVFRTESALPSTTYLRPSLDVPRRCVAGLVVPPVVPVVPLVAHLRRTCTRVKAPFTAPFTAPAPFKAPFTAPACTSIARLSGDVYCASPSVLKCIWDQTHMYFFC
jgi:hypothetical protein